MHGLPSSTDLRFLVGVEVIQVAVGRFQTAIHFNGDVTVTIEGECEVEKLRCDPGVEAGRQLLSFIGRRISTARSVDERHLELTFDDDRVLKVLENDEPFESFSLTAPDVTIVV